ncbi:MAG: hypothetical protein QOE51_282 [Actinoplanes sp.]|nr:hypothetical protein [Actinoplanes sp.]
MCQVGLVPGPGRERQTRHLRHGRRGVQGLDVVACHHGHVDTLHDYLAGPEGSLVVVAVLAEPYGSAVRHLE